MQCLIIRDIRSLGIKRNNEGWVSDNKQMAERVSDYKRYLNQKEKLIRERVDYLSGDKLFGNFSHKREAKKLFVNFPVSTKPPVLGKASLHAGAILQHTMQNISSHII